MNRKKLRLFVNILLKDGTYLKEAGIYPTGQIGEWNIIDEKEIAMKFQCYNFDVFKMEDLIVFQTENINGKFHPANVKWYEIVKESEVN